MTKKFVMKKIARVLSLIFFAFISIAFAQEKASEWIRVQSDNGEFSIEVPTQNNYFYDKEGFSVSEDNSNYRVKEMNLLNAFKEKTLLSVEIYEAKKDALKTFYPFRKTGELSDFKLDTLTAKQHIDKKDDFYSKTLYFHSKKHIYIITAASRNGETTAMKHFFDSIIFKSDTKNETNSGAILFSSLKATMIDLRITKGSEAKTEKKIKAPKDDGLSKLILVSKPKPAYVDSARMRGVQGLIRMKTLFSQDGFMPKIEVTKSLPEGLLRQTVFAALRIKFLPEEKDGNPQNVTKTIEYNFTLY